MSSKVCSCILFCRLLAKANFNTLLQCKYYTSLYIYIHIQYISVLSSLRKKKETRRCFSVCYPFKVKQSRESLLTNAQRPTALVFLH